MTLFLTEELHSGCIGRHCLYIITYPSIEVVSLVNMLGPSKLIKHINECRKSEKCEALSAFYVETHMPWQIKQCNEREA